MRGSKSGAHSSFWAKLRAAPHGSCPTPRTASCCHAAEIPRGVSLPERIWRTAVGADLTLAAKAVIPPVMWIQVLLTCGSAVTWPGAVCTARAGRRLPQPPTHGSISHSRSATERPANCSALARPARDWTPGDDPAAVQGAARTIEPAVEETFRILERRIDLFMCWPIASLDRTSLRERVGEIGQR